MAAFVGVWRCECIWTVKGCGSQWISCCLRFAIRTEIERKNYETTLVLSSFPADRSTIIATAQYHLQSSAVIFNLQRSVFCLRRFVQLYCTLSLNLANLSKSIHIISVFFLWVVTPTRLGFAVTTSASLHSFNFTLVCTLVSDQLSSSSRDPRGTSQRGHTLTH